MDNSYFRRIVLKCATAGEVEIDAPPNMPVVIAIELQSEQGGGLLDVRYLILRYVKDRLEAHV